MNLINRMMSYDKTKTVNQKCDCEKCVKVENQTVEYPPLTEEEIEQIIEERYSDKDEKTKTFIRKALRIHGDKYDYSNVVYIKSSEKVEIICRIKGHETFWQTPCNHLHKHGCPKCKFMRLSEFFTYSLEEFIKNANKIHNYKYDYSKVEYVNSKTKITIICPKHGEFLQTPFSHLRGEGCSYCSGKHNYTTEEFIKKANEVHGFGTYDYSEVKYINAITKVTILCPKHGEFEQMAQLHLRGYGCQKCKCIKISEKRRMSKEEFIAKANEIHRINKYDYSKVDYQGNKIKVCIICNNHEHPFEFWQKPNSHLRGEGCPKCKSIKQSQRQNSTTENFIEKANKKHGMGTYDYSKVKYINAYTKVEIICPKHGKFSQMPSSHLNGQGCPKCNKYKGEIVIRDFLTKYKMEFEEQKKFKGCKDKRELKFDFYLLKYNLCIEYDGIQHFEKVNWDGKYTDEKLEENLQSCKLRDQIKNEYCKNNKINLLRIKYNENIEEKLTEYFQNHKV